MGPTPDDEPVERSRQLIELLSAVLMAVATIATAWSAYQTSEWNSLTGHFTNQATTAIVRVGKFTNLELQRTSLHVTLFVPWLSAVKSDNPAKADFLLQRFPEPLKTATEAWLATNPFTNPGAPPSPFDMPEYALAEQRDVERWSEKAETAFAEAERANVIASRYMMFSIIFASVLFFGGISGKIRALTIDRMVLTLGAVTLAVGLAIMLWSPKA